MRRRRSSLARGLDAREADKVPGRWSAIGPYFGIDVSGHCFGGGGGCQFREERMTNDQNPMAKSLFEVANTIKLFSAMLLVPGC